MISIQGKDTVILFAKCNHCGDRLILVRNPKRPDADLPYCRNCLHRSWGMIKEGKIKDLVK